MTYRDTKLIKTHKKTEKEKKKQKAFKYPIHIK